MKFGNWTLKNRKFYHETYKQDNTKFCGGELQGDSCNNCGEVAPKHVISITSHIPISDKISAGLDKPAEVRHNSSADSKTVSAPTNTQEENIEMSDPVNQNENESVTPTPEQILEYLKQNPSLTQAVPESAESLTFEIRACSTEKFRLRNYVDVFFNRKPTAEEKAAYLDESNPNSLKANGFIWLSYRNCWSGPAKTLVDSDIYGAAARAFIPEKLLKMLR